MEIIKNLHGVLIAPFIMMIFMALPMQAQADWSNTGIHPVPVLNFVAPERIDYQHRAEPVRPTNRPASPVVRPHPVRQDHLVNKPQIPGYFRRDANYYGHSHIDVPFPDSDVDTQNQLTAIPPVFGAVVDSIPQDYQVVMADGDYYLMTGGVYYQRTDQGFQVVQPPVLDQE